MNKKKPLLIINKQMITLSKLPYQLVTKIPKNSFCYIFIDKYPIYHKYLFEELNQNNLLTSELDTNNLVKNIEYNEKYFQHIKGDKDLKYLISSFLVGNDDNYESYDLMTNFMYKNYFVTEHLKLNYTDSKKCINCFVWDYKVKLLIQNNKKKIFFNENKCCSKLLLSKKTPFQIQNLFIKIKDHIK